MDDALGVAERFVWQGEKEKEEAVKAAVPAESSDEQTEKMSGNRQQIDQSAALVRLLVCGEHLELKRWLELRRIVTGGAPVQPAEIAMRIWGDRGEQYKNYTTVEWVLTHIGAGSSEILLPGTEGGQVWSVSWVERPGIDTEIKIFSKVPTSLDPGHEAYLRGAIGAMPAEVLEGVLRGLVQAESDIEQLGKSGCTVEEAKKAFAQALFLHSLRVLIQKEHAKVPSEARGWLADKEIGGTISSDYQLVRTLLRWLRTNRNHLVRFSLKQAGSPEESERSLRQLHRELFRLCLAMGLTKADGSLVVPSGEGEHVALVDQLFPEIREYDQIYSSADLAEDWVHIVGAWQQQKHAVQCGGDFRLSKHAGHRVALRVLLDKPLTDPKQALTIQTTIRLTDMLLEALFTDCPIFHGDPRGVLCPLRRDDCAEFLPSQDHPLPKKKVFRPRFAEPLAQKAVRKESGNPQREEATMPEPPSAEDLKMVLAALKFFYSEEERLGTLRSPENLRVRAALLLYTFGQFADKNSYDRMRQSEKQLTLDPERQFQKSLAELKEFSSTATPEERLLFLSHACWTPQYWEEKTWSEQENLFAQAQFHIPEEERKLHQNHIRVMSLLARRLCLPFALKAPESDKSIYDLIKTKAAPKGADENEVWQVYDRLFQTIYADRMVVGPKERVGQYVIPADSQTPGRQPSEQPAGSQKPSEAVAAQRRESEVGAVGLLFPGARAYTRAEIAQLFDDQGPPNSLLQQAYNELTEIYRQVGTPEGARRFPLLRKFWAMAQRSASPSPLEQWYAFYQVPFWKQLMEEAEQRKNHPDRGFARLAGQPSKVQWKEEPGAKLCYEEALRTLLMLTYARLELEEAERVHRLAGFIYEPDYETEEFFRDPDGSGPLLSPAEQLQEARKHYLRSYALYLTIADPQYLGRAYRYPAASSVEEPAADAGGTKWGASKQSPPTQKKIAIGSAEDVLMEIGGVRRRHRASHMFGIDDVVRVHLVREPEPKGVPNAVATLIPSPGPLPWGPLPRIPTGPSDLLGVSEAPLTKGEDLSRFDVRIFCRPTPLEALLRGKITDRALSTKDGLRPAVAAPPLVLADGVFRGIIQNRTGLERVDAGEDACGFTGAVEMVAGVEELFQKLEFLAHCLQEGMVEQVVQPIHQSLTLQREEFGTRAMDQRVIEEGYRLAAIELQLAQSQLMEQRAALEMGIRESELFAAHFNTEAARQLAEAAHLEAAQALLEGNIRKYELFVIKAEYEMLMTALPSYLLQLHRAEAGLGASEQLLGELKEELYKKRQEYLRNKSKDIGSIIRAVVVGLVDAVASVWGLPPIGSIVNRTFEGIQALSRGEWGVAFNNFANVAKLSGLDKEAEEFFQRQVNNIQLPSWVHNIRNSPGIQSIASIARDSGLEEFGKAKALAVLNAAGKSFLPPDLADALVPPENFQWANDVSSEQIKQLLVAQAVKQGTNILKELGRSSLLQALSALGADNADKKGSKFYEFLVQKTGLQPEERADFEGALTKCLHQARTEVSTAFRALFEDKKLELRQQVALALAVNKLRRDAPPQIQDGDFDKLLAQICSSRDPTEWAEALQNFVHHQGYDQTIQKLFQEHFTADNLRKGIVPTAHQFFDCLAQAVVHGTFELHLNNVQQSQYSRENLQQQLQQLRQQSKQFADNFSEMLITMQATLDLAVSVEITRNFYPQTKGKLIEVLLAWEQELYSLFGEATNQMVADDINRYYQFVKQSFRQVNLQEVMTPEQFARFCNPPPVTLGSNYRQKIEQLDAALLAATQAIRGMAEAEGTIRKYIPEVAKASDDTEFEKGCQNLFGDIEKCLKEAKNQIKNAQRPNEGAIPLVGFPHADIRAAFETNQPGTLGKALKEFGDWDLARFRKLSKLAGLKDAIAEAEKFRPFPQARLGELNAQLQQELQELKEAYSQAKANEKLEEVQRLLVAVMNRILPEEKRITEEERGLLFISTDELANAKNLSEQRKKQLHQQSAQLVHRKLYHLFDQQPSGLYAELAVLRQTNWAKEVEAISADLAQQSAQRRAVSAALAASALRAHTNAQKIRVEQAKLEMEMAKIGIQVLQKLRSAQLARLRAAEYDYQAAATQRDLALLEMWRWRMSGGDLEVLCPEDIQLISNVVWQIFRDIGFFAAYYEQQDQRNELRSFIQRNLQGKDRLLNPPSVWKPEAIRKAIDLLKLSREIKPARFNAAYTVWNVGRDSGLRIDYETLRTVAIPVAGRNDYVCFLVEVLAKDAETIYQNPFAARESTPTIRLFSPSSPLGAPPEITEKRKQDNQNKHTQKEQPQYTRPTPKPCLQTYIPENPTRYATRLIEVCAIANLPEGISLQDFLFRHLGDGYLTVPAKGPPGKRVVAIRWQPPNSVRWRPAQLADTRIVHLRDEVPPKDPLQTAVSVVPLSVGRMCLTDSSVAALLEARISDRIRSALEIPLNRRSAYYNYPACGTYEFFVPRKLLETPKAADGKNWEIVFYIIGSCTGG
ncbi:MAG: hypothetical protein NZ602_03530 [Thermoguttaceae bacterium]|nr:hypothetical protein [Thermoguttaceae bacterium]